MKNHWIKRQELRKKLTRDRIIAMTIAQDINQWLHQKGDSVHKYVIFLDRVCDIATVVEEATKRANKLCDEHGIL